MLNRLEFNFLLIGHPVITQLATRRRDQRDKINEIGSCWYYLKFPYRILNDLSTKLKAAEDKLIQDRKLYEAKIADMRDEIESGRDASEVILNLPSCNIEL